MFDETIKTQTCPTDEIAAYIDGELNQSRELELDVHFAGCSKCTADLNDQKQFLQSLDLSLKQDKEIDLPENFTKVVVANAESNVSGLRRPSERYNALFVCAGLLLFVLFALGADATRLFDGVVSFAEQVAAVGGFFGHLIYSFFVGLTIIVRSVASQTRFDVTTVIGLSIFVAAFSLFVSRKVLQARGT